MAATDSLLLNRARQGDWSSFDELFLRYYSRIHAVVFRMTGDTAEADDITQETFIRLYHHPPEAAGREHNVGGWLYRVAVNLGYNALRAARRRAVYELAADRESTADPESVTEQHEERLRVRSALAELPPQQAQLLMLRHAGLSYKELAAALDVAPTSVGTLLARAERAFEVRYRAMAGSGGLPGRPDGVAHAGQTGGDDAHQ